MSDVSAELDNKKVKKYSFPESCWVEPQDGEYFLYQHEYLGDHAENNIVVRLKPDGKILRIVNVAHVSEIIFEDDCGTPKPDNGGQS